MLKHLKRKIENGESLHELRNCMIDLKEEEKGLVYSYYYFFNGNYGSAAITLADAIDTLPVEELLTDINILYSSFGDFLCGFLCGRQLSDCCDTCVEGASSCSFCWAGVALICGAAICATCMKNTGMEGSCCWNFCEGIQDCICGCTCETIPDLICDCICGTCSE